ncbi:MAG TPA: PEP-CTERM sorting domain-containing protein, partial [Lacipirellulaceae bacterium]
LHAHAVEIVFGWRAGFDDYAVFRQDADDPTSLASQIAGPFTSPVLTNGLGYWDGKIYAETKTGPMDKAVYEVNLDGSGFMTAQSVPTQVAYAFQGVALTLDGSAGYYVAVQQDRIVRQDLEAFEPIRETTILETDDLYLADIALDQRNGKIYWFAALSPTEDGVIQRANFDGTGLETLVDINDGLNPDYAPVNLELDVAREKMYWSSIQGDIRRANLDGTNIEVVIPEVGFHGFALVIDPVPEPAAWLLALGAGGALCCARSRRR